MNHLFSRALRQLLAAATRLLPSGKSTSSPGFGTGRDLNTRTRPSSAQKTRHRTDPATQASSSRSSSIGQYPVQRGLPDFEYAPNPDSYADPGEVAWTWVPYQEDASKGKDRPVLVLARIPAGLLVAQLTSKDHDRDAANEARFGRYWFDIGAGPWDRAGRASEARLDRLLWVTPDAVRRAGGRLDKSVFDAVTAAIRRHHNR